MTEPIPGVETIIGGAGPREILITRTLSKQGDSLRRKWNALYIAFLPYCISCKTPLRWHFGEGGIMFSCDRCRRKWTIDKGGKDK